MQRPFYFRNPMRVLVSDQKQSRMFSRLPFAFNGTPLLNTHQSHVHSAAPIGKQERWYQGTDEGTDDRDSELQENLCPVHSLTPP